MTLNSVPPSKANHFDRKSLRVVSTDYVNTMFLMSMIGNMCCSDNFQFKIAKKIPIFQIAITVSEVCVSQRVFPGAITNLAAEIA